jgi:predicted transcriptional regulator
MCVKPDGTLAPNAKKIIKACRQGATIDEMAQETGLRSFRIKSSIRELTGAGLLEQQDDQFVLTSLGANLLRDESD